MDTADPYGWGDCTGVATTQIDVGRAELEARIGRRLVSFAYPHGGHGDVGDTRRAVQSAGFSQAFTALAGTVRVGADRPLASTHSRRGYRRRGTGRACCRRDAAIRVPSTTIQSSPS